jgi:two-component system OmpR family response regulator
VEEYIMTTRILIIDDERDLCHLLKIVLLKERFLVDCAFSLLDADKKLLRNPHIVFLDNNLPDGSGLDYFHENPTKFINCSVILITADGSLSTKMQALETGIDIFIEKPFSVREIKDIIKKICQRNETP